jgi:NAD(P)-dependent dehydrogenase (short-subunit alcohol dehydrogenase family)
VFVNNSVPYDLEGKIALVTGAAQGLDLGIADTLACRGAHVVIGDLQAEKAAADAQTLRQQKLDADSIPLNIADSASVDRSFEQILRSVVIWIFS